METLNYVLEEANEAVKEFNESSKKFKKQMQQLKSDYDAIVLGVVAEEMADVKVACQTLYPDAELQDYETGFFLLFKKKPYGKQLYMLARSLNEAVGIDSLVTCNDGDSEYFSQFSDKKRIEVYDEFEETDYYGGYSIVNVQITKKYLKSKYNIPSWYVIKKKIKGYE